MGEPTFAKEHKTPANQWDRSSLMISMVPDPKGLSAEVEDNKMSPKGNSINNPYIFTDYSLNYMPTSQAHYQPPQMYANDP